MRCSCGSGPACSCEHEKCQCCPFLCDCEKCFAERENSGVHCEHCGGGMNSDLCILIHRWRPQLNPTMDFIRRHKHWISDRLGECRCSNICDCCPFLCPDAHDCEEVQHLATVNCELCNGGEIIGENMCNLMRKWRKNGLYPSLDFLRAHASQSKYQPVIVSETSEDSSENKSSSDPSSTASELNTTSLQSCSSDENILQFPMDM